MTWGFVAGAAITVVGGAIANNQSNKAAGRAANATRDAQLAGINEQARQYDQTREDLMPWLDAGKFALPLLQQSFSGDNTAFFNSPDYLSTQKQGLQFLDRSAAARGGLFGGGHTKDLVGYGQDLAAQQLGNYRSGLAQLAGMGQGTAQSLGQFGANKANAIGNAYGNIGNARASSYQQIGNNNAQFAAGTAGVFNNLLQYYGSKNGGFGGV